MAYYQGISGSIFYEPEYRSAEDLVVAVYIIVNRDMAGVTPINTNITSKLCRLPRPKFKKIIKYFELQEKLIISNDFTHVWWKSGIFHSLNKGKYSKTQLKSVQKLLKKWQFSGKFSLKHGENFIEMVTQHYVSKYSLVIPYPTLIESDTESESDKKYVHIDSGTVHSTKSKQPAKKQNPGESSKESRDINKARVKKNEEPIDPGFWKFCDRCWKRISENVSDDRKDHYRHMYHRMKEWIGGAKILGKIRFDKSRIPTSDASMEKLILFFIDKHEDRYRR